MSMEPAPAPPAAAPATLVWWIIWFSILNGLIVVYVVLGPKGSSSPSSAPVEISWLTYLTLVPLLLSIGLRWVLLPRVTQKQTALVVFIVGLALAEGSGYLGIFLGKSATQGIVTLSLLGILQWAPLFARRFYEPSGKENAYGLRQP
jgi:hypothetical protein